MLQHIACAGQTLSELAVAYGCPAAELAEVNGFPVEAPLVPGVVVWIPAVQQATPAVTVEETPPVRQASDQGTPPVLRVPATIFSELRRHAERSGNGRLVLNVRSASEGDVTHLHFPGNSLS